jgi:RNA polymerase sigma factor (sigma-70 family)
VSASHVTRAGRDAALTAFYRAHQHRLLKRVHASARRAGDTVAEDACAYAWLQLVRRTDIQLDRSGFAWLATVAVHEAWRLTEIGREQLAGPFLPEIDHPDELPEPAGHAADPLELVIAAELHHARRVAFSCLEARERRELLLHAGGYRYHEIAELTGTSYTAVNRWIAQARTRLRHSWGANNASTGL